LRHGVFTDRQIESLIFKSTDTTAQYQEALSKLKTHQDLITLGPGDDGRIRYTSRANFVREASMNDQVEALSLRQQHSVSTKQITRTAQSFSLSKQQSIALKHVLNGQGVAALVGRAGAGKSYMMGAAREAWEQSGYRVQGLALAGKAAKGLEHSSGIKSRTIASFKKQELHSKQSILDKNTVVVLDEAGMVAAHDMADLVQLCHDSGAKLVVLGDPDQLQPIDAGAPFRAILQRQGFAEIAEIRRQVKDGDKSATCLLAQGDISAAIDHYEHQDQLHWFKTDDDTAIGLINDWSAGITHDNLASTIILAHRNVDVDKLNLLARDELILNNMISESIEINILSKRTNKGAKLPEFVPETLMFGVGERIIFTQNDSNLRVYNGDFATIIAIDKINKQIHAKLDDGKEIDFSAKSYRHFNYGYTATVHKSQGSTFNDVFVYVGGNYWNRFLTYVAFSRHKESLNIYASSSSHKDLDYLKETLSRDEIRDNIIDFPLSYAIRYGFDPDSMAGRFINFIYGKREQVYDAWLFVTNHETYLRRKAAREKQTVANDWREKSIKVCAYIDAYREVGKIFSSIDRDIPDTDRWIEHKDYAKALSLQKNRNELAHTIDNESFKDIVELHNVDKEKLHEHAQRFEKAYPQRENLSLHDTVFHDEWPSLEAIDSPTINRVLLARSRLEQATKPISVAIQTQGYEEAIKSLCRQQDVFSKVKHVAPKLSSEFEKIIQPLQPVKIDWLSSSYDVEFKNLLKSKDTTVQYLVKIRNRLGQVKSTPKQETLIRQLEITAHDIRRYKRKQNQFKQLAPKLSVKLLALEKFKAQEKEI